MEPYARIVVEAPVTALYDYRIPAALQGVVRVGSCVVVPFGGRRVRGFCAELTHQCAVAEAKLKDVLSCGSEEDRVPAGLLELTRWVASYYHASWGSTLAAAVPTPVRRGQRERIEVRVALSAAVDVLHEQAAVLARRAPKQAAVLTHLVEHLGPEGADESLRAADVEAAVGTTRAALKALERKGWVTLSAVPQHRVLAGLAEAEKRIVLNEAQAHCVARLDSALKTRTFHPFLLYGVTGSGKTEVYLRALREALALKRGVLVLVPEISLTPQTVERFRRGAGEVAVLHSGLAAGERGEAWRRLRRGECRVVVGARSAAFAPVPDLGLIIVDEEHERTFKQENEPRYHARDVAVKRAQQEGAVVVLGSATPSLETWQNSVGGKYERLSLPHRVGKATLPQATIVDMRREWAEVKQATVFSRELRRRLEATVGRGEQAILLLNRRGFHTFVHCGSCGDVLRCPSCDISLTYHRRAKRLRCHYCEYEACEPSSCPACGARGLRFGGTGTERAEDVLTRILPGARLARMDSDVMTGRDAHAEVLTRFARGDVDVLLGTQMVAKGFDFPNVTLVGVLAADGAINLPDFRAAERCFQLIAQVMGRAGRADKPGHAVIQAFQPQHYAVTSALKQDYEGFARRELRDRLALGYPPFARLARVLVRGKRRERVEAEAKEVAGLLSQQTAPGVEVLGPARCPIERLHDQSRYHLLVKAPTHRELSAALAALNRRGTRRRGVQTFVDIDAVSLL